MRFTVVEQPTLHESDVDEIDDGYEASGLPERTKLALRFTDAFLAARAVDAETAAAMRDEFSDEEIAELGMGLALFHGFSKFLIVTGCEPEEMATTMLTAPGSPVPPPSPRD